MQENLHYQLSEAKSILFKALDNSFDMVKNGGSKQEVGQVWSDFLSDFYKRIKQESRARRENLLNWVRVPK